MAIVALINTHKEEFMKVTLSVLKADIGSIGGHIKPSRALIDEVTHFVRENGKDLIIDSYISHTGDDIAILCTHDKGAGDEKVHLQRLR